MFYLSNHQRVRSAQSKLKRGFTLLELMVVVAIFLITTGIVLSNFKGFTRKSSLDLLAREISLIIRQAQVYGTATREFTGPVNPTQERFPSYGVYFRGEDAGVVMTSFILFADKDDDGRHFTGSTCRTDFECVEEFKLYGGAVIKDVQGCWYDGTQNPPYSCEVAKRVIAAQIPQPNNWLNITFPRPEPGAVFSINCSGSNCPAHLGEYSYAKITIEDPAMTAQGVASSTRDIIIWRTGHIYVDSELN